MKNKAGERERNLGGDAHLLEREARAVTTLMEVTVG